MESIRRTELFQLREETFSDRLTNTAADHMKICEFSRGVLTLYSNHFTYKTFMIDRFLDYLTAILTAQAVYRLMRCEENHEW
jgi:hypothetical protein